jgi:hypothetical protein
MSTFALAVEPSQILCSWPMGAGSDMADVEKRIRELRADYQNSRAITYRRNNVTCYFLMLAQGWRDATKFESSMDRITRHPAYRAIMDLGDEVVPLLLEELRRRPEPWFTALRHITGANPVAHDQRGDMNAMASAWVRWGQENGLIQG